LGVWFGKSFPSSLPDDFILPIFREEQKKLGFQQLANWGASLEISLNKQIRRPTINSAWLNMTLKIATATDFDIRTRRR